MAETVAEIVKESCLQAYSPYFFQPAFWYHSGPSAQMVSVYTGLVISTSIINEYNIA